MHWLRQPEPGLGLRLGQWPAARLEGRREGHVQARIQASQSQRRLKALHQYQPCLPGTCCKGREDEQQEEQQQEARPHDSGETSVHDAVSQLISLSITHAEDADSVEIEEKCSTNRRDVGMWGCAHSSGVKKKVPSKNGVWAVRPIKSKKHTKNTHNREIYRYVGYFNWEWRCTDGDWRYYLHCMTMTDKCKIKDMRYLCQFEAVLCSMFFLNGIIQKSKTVLLLFIFSGVLLF